MKNKMKKQMKTILSLSKYILLTVVCILMTQSVNGQMFSDKEKITKSFPVGSGTTLDITNKYGKIHIVNWQKDSIRLEVEIFYRSNQFSKMQKAKDNLSFSFTGTLHFVTAKTEFGNNRSSFASAMKNLTESFVADNSLEINYLVYMPDYINLKINNKYGDFYMDNHKGNLSLILSNGNVKINEVLGNTYIDHKFGNATIGKLNTAHFLGSYSELQLKSAEQLNLETKSSTISIENVNVLKIKSRRDKIFVGKVNNVYGSTYFTDGNFQNLAKELNLNTHYGVFNFNSLPVGLKYINLVCKYSDLNLFFESGVGYNVDFQLKNARFLYPLDIYKVVETLDQKEKTVMYSGTAGQGTNLPNFKLNAENGSIVISHK